MKKYTSEEVIDLVRQYFDQDEDCINFHDSTNAFKDWLKDKEQSELPVKDQLIWVRDIDESLWKERYFAKFVGEIAFCYPDSNKSDNEISEDDLNLVPWDEWSLTNRNK